MGTDRIVIERDGNGQWPDDVIAICLDFPIDGEAVVGLLDALAAREEGSNPK